MQFLVLSSRDRDRYTPEQFAAHLPAETRRVRQLYAQGLIRQIWQRDDVPGAALLVEAPSMLAAGTVVDSLPLAQLLMSEFTVIPLRPYRGFGPDDDPFGGGPRR